MTRQNLDTVKTEIAEFLQSRDFVVFHGFSRMAGSMSVVSWDTGHYTDFRAFLETAQALAVKVVVFNHREFAALAVDNALDRLEDAEMDAEDRRRLERRLRELRVYQGLICAIELSYDYDGRLYLFNLLSDWYIEFLNTADEIDSYLPEEDMEDEGEDEGPIDGYFSRN